MAFVGFLFISGVMILLNWLKELPTTTKFFICSPQFDHISPLYKLKLQCGMKKSVFLSTTRFASSLWGITSQPSSEAIPASSFPIAGSKISKDALMFSSFRRARAQAN